MIDCHAHLSEIDDVEGALARAQAAGITGIVAVGMDAASNRATLELHQPFPGLVYPALGSPLVRHPGRCRRKPGFYRGDLPRCVALGEVGLDYQAKVNKKLQQEVLALLLDLAARLK